jgi:hypothetical protein
MRDAASVPYMQMPESTRVSEPMSEETAAPEAAPVFQQPAYTEPVVRAPVAPVAEPVAAAPAPAAAPMQALKLDWPSDLQQVETSRERQQAAAQASADDGAPKRVKRVRQPVENVPSEPLQQVETRG